MLPDNQAAIPAIAVKSPEQRLREAMQKRVNRLVELKKAQETLKQEQAVLEAELLRVGLEDLRDTKFKSVTYGGDTGRATITIAESLKLIYPSFLREVFGIAYRDAVTEDVTYKLSKPAARMLTGLWTGGYTKMTLAQVIDGLPTDSETKAALLKKLRGINYATDKKNLMAIGGFEESEAEGYAYFISEAAVWESFQRLLQANKTDDGQAVEHLLNQIAGACIVEESPKVTIEVTEGA